MRCARQIVHAMGISLALISMSSGSVLAQRNEPDCSNHPEMFYSCLQQNKNDAVTPSTGDVENLRLNGGTSNSTTEPQSLKLSLEDWKDVVFTVRGMQMMYEMISRFQKVTGALFIEHDMDYDTFFKRWGKVHKKLATCAGISEDQADDTIHNSDKYMQQIDKYQPIVKVYKFSYPEYRELEGNGDEVATREALRHSGAKLSLEIKAMVSILEEGESQTCEQISQGLVSAEEASRHEEEAKKQEEAHNHAMQSGWVTCVQKAQEGEGLTPSKLEACDDQYPFVGDHNVPPPGNW